MRGAEGNAPRRIARGYKSLWPVFCWLQGLTISYLHRPTQWPNTLQLPYSQREAHHWSGWLCQKSVTAIVGAIYPPNTDTMSSVSNYRMAGFWCAHRIRRIVNSPNNFINVELCKTALQVWQQ